MGLRAHDHTCVPLCQQCHKDHHEFRGVFRNMDKTERKQWQEDMSVVFRGMYEGVEDV